MQQIDPVAARQSFLRVWATVSKRLFPALLGIGVISLIGYGVAGGQETEPSFELSSAAQQGKQLAPVPLDLKGKSAQLVYRGSYLVNSVASCNSCHTCPSYRGINPYKVGGAGLTGLVPINTLNYLGGGTPFVNGSVVAPNLTPDGTGKPGGLTLNQFKNALTDGVAHTGGRILQVMPWPIYRGMTGHDLNAIYQYLRAIPPAPAGQCTGPDETR